MKKIQKKYRELSTEEQVRVVAQVAIDQKALDVVAIDVRGLTSFADYFVIMGGSSTRHVQGLADNIDKEISSKRSKASETEGLNEGQWILLDYGDLIVHIFYHEIRPQFDLEGLWHDAPRLDLSRPVVVKEATRKKAVAKGPVAVKSGAKSAEVAPKKSTRKAVVKPKAQPAAKSSRTVKSAAKPARRAPAKPVRNAKAQSAAGPQGKSTTKPTPRAAAKPTKATRPAATFKAKAKPAAKPTARPVRKTTTAKPQGKPTGRIKK